MNRLVIIGNGFDLAHGLPTGYCDFIDYLWTKILLNPNQFNDLVFIDEMLYSFLKEKEIKNYSDFILNMQDFNNRNIGTFNRCGWDDIGYYVVEHGRVVKMYIFKYTNYILKIICNIKNLNNWVDVENEYYKLLKESLKENDNQAIVEINNQFDIIKNNLNEYLLDVEKEYDFTNLNRDFIKIFENKTYKGTELDSYFKEISKKGETMLKDDYQSFMKKSTGYSASSYKHLEVNMSNFFLSFNYTSTMIFYLNFLSTKNKFLNEIHGSILDKSNPINFGFGDEMDRHYQEIEEKNDNEYLRNIKSFQYLNTPNYRRLLDLIDSNVFQVYIMGHSCGLSDRTLLNTIFEHENCCSIKVFYHQKEDGTDNYTEITQNISRHFNKKKLMREKIVNKTLSQPMPQIKLPKKNAADTK